MLAYKIVLSVMFSCNILLQTAKAVQAARYSAWRVTIINAIGVAIAITMLAWTWTL